MMTSFLKFVQSLTYLQTREETSVSPFIVDMSRISDSLLGFKSTTVNLFKDSTSDFRSVLYRAHSRKNVVSQVKTYKQPPLPSAFNLLSASSKDFCLLHATSRGESVRLDNVTTHFAKNIFKDRRYCERDMLLTTSIATG